MFAVILLWRHVRKGTDEHARLRFGVFQNARNAEIDHLDGAVFAEHHVARFDVAVNDASLMRVVEGPARLHCVGELEGQGQRQFSCNDLLEIFALDQFHRDVRQITGLTHVVDRDDVGVLKSAGGLRLAVEAF